MGRLIDTENFSKVMQDYFADMITLHAYNVDCVDCNADLQHLLDEQPTGYDVDKVVAELEENAGRYTKKYVTPYRNNGYKDIKAISIHKAIEIVKQGGVSDDVCEWKLDNVGADIGCRSDLHHTGYINRTNCPYCGKKIKVVQ